MQLEVGIGKLNFGIGAWILVTNDKFASFETDVWETNDVFDSFKKSKVESEEDEEEEEEASVGFWDGNLSEKSEEKEAIATAVKATNGRWRIPDKEPISKTQIRMSHANTGLHWNNMSQESAVPESEIFLREITC